VSRSFSDPRPFLPSEQVSFVDTGRTQQRRWQVGQSVALTDEDSLVSPKGTRERAFLHDKLLSSPSVVPAFSIPSRSRDNKVATTLLSRSSIEHTRLCAFRATPVATPPDKVSLVDGLPLNHLHL
jgi:hypothetical protein